MGRYDKYEPKVGGFRAPLAADFASADLEKVLGVGLDTDGRVVIGAGNTGVLGLLVLTMARKAGEIIDVMTSGEIVEFGPTVGVAGTDFGTAGTVYYSDSNGNVVAGLDEVQTATITGSPTGGTFTLTFNGQTTAAIQWNATAANVQSALEALSDIDVGDVVVSGTNPAFTITFAGKLADVNQPEITATASLTGGSTPGVTMATTTAGGGTTGLVRVGHTVKKSRLIVRVEH